MSSVHDREKLPFAEDEVQSLIARVATRGFAFDDVLTPDDVRGTTPSHHAEVGLPDAPGDTKINVPTKATATESRSRRRRLMYAAPVVAAAAVIALVAGVVLPSAKGGPTNAAAAQLHELANVAAAQPTPALQPGQYYNQVWEESAQMSPTSPPGVSLPGPNVAYLAKAQLATWVDTDGTGRCTFTPSGTAFLSPADQATWKAEGQPGLGYGVVSIDGDDVIPPILKGANALFGCPQSDSSTNGQIGTSGAFAVNGAPLQLFDVSGLPTNAASLGSLISHRDTGIEAIDSETPGEFNTFAVVVQLLSGPDVGATSEFRSALYQILAALPGVKVTNSVTDAHGRSGVEISLPTVYPFLLVTGSFVEKAIVDPDTTDLLDWSVDDVGPGGNTPATTYGWAITYEPGTVYSFALLSSGIANSDSVTVSG